MDSAGKNRKKSRSIARQLNAELEWRRFLRNLLLTASCGIEMNTDSHAVRYKGNAVELTNREFILLKILMENRGVAMTRERLLSEAWGYDYYGETNIIDVYVRYIRQKTADDVIRTIRGVGYMME